MSQIKYSFRIFIITKPECNTLRENNQADYWRNIISEVSFFIQVNIHHKLNKFENSRYLDDLCHRYRLKNTNYF